MEGTRSAEQPGSRGTGPPGPLWPIAPDGSPLATVGRRIGAVLLDLAWTVPAFILFAALFGGVEGGYGDLSASLEGGGFLLYLLAIFLVGAAFEGAFSRTPGKLLAGVRVARADGGGVGYGRALVRNLMRFVDYFLFFLVGIAAMLASRSNQRLGDRVAGTYVVLDRWAERNRRVTADSVASTWEGS